MRFDPGSIAARNGLDGVARERRHAQLVAEAEFALRAADIATAERRAAEVLGENSNHRGARAVMRQVSERRAPLRTERPQLTAALGKPITLEFRDANLRSVFEVISRTSGVNFVFDRDVRPDIRVTIFVRNTNLDDVLKLLLATNQLDRKVINENSVLIFPNTPAKQKEYQELVVRSFYVANADVKQTAAMIRALVKTRDIFIDEKLNLLVIKDTAEAVRLAEKLVATQDLGEPEVVLEVEVLEVSSSRLRELGIRYPERINYGLLGTPGVAAGTLPPFVDLRNTGGVTFFVTNPILIANLRQTDGAVNLLANPRIRVKNRDKARIHIGERVPVITTTSTANVGVSSSVSYLEVGLKLDVEPNVFLEDEVAMKVQLEVSNILEQLNVSGTVAYRLGTRNTATTFAAAGRRDPDARRADQRRRSHRVKQDPVPRRLSRAWASIHQPARTTHQDRDRDAPDTARDAQHRAARHRAGRVPVRYRERTGHAAARTQAHGARSDRARPERGLTRGAFSNACTSPAAHAGDDRRAGFFALGCSVAGRHRRGVQRECRSSEWHSATLRYRRLVV